MRLTMAVSLPQRPSSVVEARHILTVLLTLTTADDQSRDDLAILVTEACANAVQHGDPGTTIDLHVTLEPDVCVLEVGNHGRVPDDGKLTARPPDPARLNGRGLPLIAALSHRAQFVATTPGYVLLRMTLPLPADTHPRAGDPPGP